MRLDDVARLARSAKTLRPFVTALDWTPGASLDGAGIGGCDAQAGRATGLILMREIVLRAPDDVDGWRLAARALAETSVPPEAVVWRVSGDAPDLFVSAPDEADAPKRALRVPRRFVDLAECVACHKDPERFAFLYRLLCRLQDEPRLLEVTTDDDVFRIEMMAKSVRRDRHKMTAFVRFKEVKVEGAEPAFLAWFEPEHHILALTHRSSSSGSRQCAGRS